MSRQPRDIKSCRRSPGCFVPGGRQLQFTEEAFNCDAVRGPILSRVCQRSKRSVDSVLEQLGLEITSDEVIFSLHDGTDRSLPTGHSCTTTAKLYDYWLRISGKRRVPLAITTPSRLVPDEAFSIVANIAGEVWGQADVRYRYGVRFFGSCSTIGSDSVTFRGSLGTSVRLGLFLVLDPRIQRLSPTSFKVIVRPRAVVMIHPDNIDIDYEIYGADYIGSVWTALTSIFTGAFGWVDVLLSGDSLTDWWRGLDEELILSLAHVGAVADVDFHNLPGTFRSLIRDKIRDSVDDIESALGRKVQRRVFELFDVDANGERSFEVDLCSGFLARIACRVVDLFKPDEK